MLLNLGANLPKSGNADLEPLRDEPLENGGLRYQRARQDCWQRASNPLRYRRRLVVKALHHRAGEATVVDVESPACGAGEALLAVRLAGICGTDLEVVRGYRDVAGIMGHELVGQVIECPSKPELVGRRVVSEINVSCGACPRCRAGQTSHCATRTVVGIQHRPGCFAERIAVPAANVHVVPDHVEDRTAVFVEPLAAAYQIATQLDVTSVGPVAVLGDGKLGLLIAMALAERGAPLTLIGRHARKLAIATDAGIDTALVDDATDRQFAVVVEATGSTQGIATALNLVAPCGTLVLKSTFAEPPRLDTTRVVVDEITIRGSRCGPFDVAVDALQRGVIDPRPLIDAIYPLVNGVAALQHAARKGTLKVLLDPRQR